MREARTMKLGKYKGNDVELCRTTSPRVEEQTVKALLADSIPFSRASVRIPFFKREKYNGASEFFVISTSPRRYSQARRTLDGMDLFYKKRLVLSNY